MKRRAQLGGAQRRGPASEVEEDIPPPAAAGAGFVDGACGHDTRTNKPRRPHYGVKRQSLQNALSTHHTRHPRPRRQAQPYLAEETDTDARRRGRRGGTPTGGRGRNARDTTHRRPRPPRGAPKAPKGGEQRGRAARGRLRAAAPAPQGRPPNGRAGRGGSRSPQRTRAPDRTADRTRGGRPPPPRPQKEGYARGAEGRGRRGGRHAGGRRGEAGNLRRTPTPRARGGEGGRKA